MIFQGVFIGFQAKILMDLIKYWSSFINVWPSNQNVRVLGMFLQLWALYLCWFYNDGFVTNLVLEILVVLLNLETKKLVFYFLILRETWPTFDKNLLSKLEVWTHEKNQCFCKMGIIVIDDWVTHFRVFVGATLTSSLLKTTWSW
jgi:hypothetical protein